MEREEFKKNLSTLLDVLGKSGNNLLIYGGEDTDEGLYFCIRSKEFFRYNVEFGKGEDILLCLNGISADDITGMFSEYVTGRTLVMHISVDG